MMHHRWLRTNMREVKTKLDTEDASYEETFEGVPMMYLRALRSDGQMFMSYAPVGSDDAKPEKLRNYIDSMLNDPALSGVVNADEMERNILTDRYKGLPDWTEEP